MFVMQLPMNTSSIFSPATSDSVLTSSWSLGQASSGYLTSARSMSMARAARSVQKDMGVVTIEMKTSFLQPAKGRLTARGRLLHRTQRLAFVEATIFDISRARCAHATGTFRYVSRNPPGQADTPIATD